jgi:hypothetical protein
VVQEKLVTGHPPVISKTAVYFGLGQSLMEGVCRTKAVTSTKPIAPGRALMFDPSPRVSLPFENHLLTNLQSHISEEPLTEATRAILPALDTTIITANLGRRRTRLVQIIPNRDGRQTQYSGLKTLLGHIADQGHTITQVIVSWIHGHSDRGLDKAHYRRAIKSLHLNLKRDALAITGRDTPVLICASQTCAALDGPIPDMAPTARAYLVIAQKHPDFFILACPEYFLARSFDGVHLSPQATALLGAYHGRAIAKRLQGQDWKPLQMISAQRQGNIITVTFTGGTGSLVVHQDQGSDKQIWGVRNLKNAGFTWETLDGTPTDIKRIKITGYREITLFLRAIPRKTSQESLSLGLFPTQDAIEGFVKGRPETGAGLASNIRTENGETDHFGTPLHDWAVLQRIDVTNM